MHVTIAICTWNRCELLRNTLEELTKLDAPADATWSVLVVNNNSTDQTEEVVRSFAARLPMRMTFEGTPGATHARNKALQEATGDYILWTDDDVLMDRRWLAEFVGCVRRFPEAAGFGGVIEPWFPEEPEEDLLRAFHWLQIGFCGTTHEAPEGPLPSDCHLIGANFGFALRTVQERRFSEALGTKGVGGMEDTEFVSALQRDGHAVVWCPRMRVRHYVEPSRMTLAYLKRYAWERGRQGAIFWPVAPDTKLLFSRPRWIWREWLKVALINLLPPVESLVPRLPSKLRSGPTAGQGASLRVRQLTWERELRFMSGTLQGYRERFGKGKETATAA
jgi:glycosyltransferase involved in cell wall biosynthesis